MQKFIDATNYNLGRGGMLTEVCVEGLKLAYKFGKYDELVSYLKELPPESALNAKGFDALVSSLDGGLTKENNLEARTR